MRIRGFYALALLGCLIGVGVALLFAPQRTAVKEPAASSSPQRPGQGTGLRVGQHGNLAYPAMADPSPSLLEASIPVATQLNAPGSSPEEDIRIVAELFQIFRRQYGAVPPGEDNVQITRALRGANPEGLVLLAPGHSALNDRYELIDRWGTPYAFHQVSRDHLGVRSAGPDRMWFTEDDLVKP